MEEFESSRSRRRADRLLREFFDSWWPLLKSKFLSLTGMNFRFAIALLLESNVWASQCSTLNYQKSLISNDAGGPRCEQ